MLKKNIGTPGRIMRGCLGLLLMFLAWWFESWILLGLSIFTFYEAIASWCVVYQLLGKNSCPR